MLANGTIAPDFSLSISKNERIRLSELKGKRVVLAFYPADWSPVCGDQLALYNEGLRFFEKRNAQLLAISVDSKWCHMAYAENRKIGFPLLADFEPKGAVARDYEAYDEKKGECQRALYVIDEDGRIAWSYLSPIDVNPGADGILDALDSMDHSK